MSFEDEIKKAFDRHAGDVRPDAAAWSGVERGVARAHARRLATLTSAIAVTVALAVTIPLVLMSNKGGPSSFADPNASDTPTPSESTVASPSASTPAAVDTSSWVGRVDVRDGVWITIPPDWKGGAFEGYWDFEPKDLPGLAEDGDTFAVEFNVVEGSYRSGEGASWEDSTLNGRDAKEFKEIKGGEYADHYRVDWYGKTLVVNITASTKALQEKYFMIGYTAAQSIRFYDGSVPVHGTLDATDDPYARALVRWLDARVEGIYAEEQACCNAESKSDLFYSDGTRAIVGWEDTHTPPKHSASAATTTYTIKILEGHSSNAASHIEYVTVGYQSGRENAKEQPVVMDFEVAR